MDIYLETERLILRHFTMDDADNLVMLDGDPEVLRYLNGGAPTPRDVIANPTFPVPPFERASGISVRPIQYDVDWPRVHTWNVNVQHALADDWTFISTPSRPVSRKTWGKPGT